MEESGTSAWLRTFLSKRRTSDTPEPPALSELDPVFFVEFNDRFSNSVIDLIDVGENKIQNNSFSDSNDNSKTYSRNVLEILDDVPEITQSLPTYDPLLTLRLGNLPYKITENEVCVIFNV